MIIIIKELKRKITCSFHQICQAQTIWYILQTSIDMQNNSFFYVQFVYLLIYFWISFGICPLQLPDWLHCHCTRISAFKYWQYYRRYFLVKNRNENNETKYKFSSNNFFINHLTRSQPHWLDVNDNVISVATQRLLEAS